MRTRLGLLATALAVLSACAGSVEKETAESVVLITIDTLRADALGPGPDRESPSPQLDRLAAIGRTFERAHAHSVMTLPSHANLLTGRLPHEHGVRDNGGFVLGPGIPTLAERLATAGFVTAAFVAAYPLHSRFGLDAGFEVYDDDFGSRTGGPFAYAERPGNEVVAPALEWWSGEAGKRRFLWVHLFEPHAPYEPAEPFRGRFPTRPYLGEVATADGYLGPLLEPILSGREDRTLIVVTSDHGEGLGEHGERTHGLFAYESTLRVPLILAGPGVTPGIDRRWARHVDVMPTVLEAAGLEVPELAGRSLLSLAAQPGPTYFEALTTHFSHGWAPLRGVLVEGEKLIELPLPELYDLDVDPREASNLFGDRRDRARRLASHLAAEPAWPPGAADLTPEEVAPLRSLGYLATRTAPKPEYTAADDPKNLLELDRMINEVVRLYTAGELRRAVTVAAELISRRPEMPLPYSYLTTILLERGDRVGAVRVMRRAERNGAAQPELLRQLGITLLTLGSPGQAVEVLEPLSRDTRDPTATSYLAMALAALGQTDEALVKLRRVAEEFPETAPAHDGLAYLAIQQGRFADARGAAQRALDANPALASAWNNLAVAEHGLGRPEAAIAAWQRALELDPVNLDTLYNLGVVASEAGREDLAREHLERFVGSEPPSSYEREIERARRLLAALGG